MIICGGICGEYWRNASDEIGEDPDFDAALEYSKFDIEWRDLVGQTLS